jgi:hypothetical protein
MGWTMLYLFVFLKLPIVAACLIVWWAVRQGTDEEMTRQDGGSPKPRRPHPRPRRPRPPRRGGPVCGARMLPPPRVRSVTAVGRARESHPRGSSRPLGDNSQ